MRPVYADGVCRVNGRKHNARLKCILLKGNKTLPLLVG